MRIRVGLTVGGVAALALGVVGTAVAAPTTAPTLARAVSAGQPAATTVRLITGDAVQVSTVAGKPRIAVSRAGTRGVTVRHLGRDTYVVPTTAARYLGRVLDPSLFDVTAAAKQGAAPTTVTLAVASGSSPSVPGLTVTGKSGSTWRGYLDTAGAKRFGAALDKQARSDAAAHRISSTLFGGVTRIAASGVTVSPPAAQPAFPQQTLTIKALDPAGKPVDYASLALVNVDDARKFVNFIDIVDGVAKVSVPTGHYAALLEYDALDGDSFLSYLVPVEGITVSSSATTTTIDTRTATTVPNVHTSRAATASTLSLEWDRTTDQGGIGSSYAFDPSEPVHVAPVKQQNGGRLDWVTGWTLAGAPTSGAPYTYDLSYHESGLVPADQNRVARTSQLATVNARYYTDGPGRATGAFGRGAVYPFQGLSFASIYDLGIPLARTEYVLSPKDALWFDLYLSAPNFDDPFQGAIFDDYRRYLAGSTRTADWVRGPLGPGFAQPTSVDPGFFCTYCRDASTLLAGLSPIADTDPAHSGSFDVFDEDTVAARFRLYRNGKLIDDVPNGTGDQVDVTAATATYRVVADTFRGLVGFNSSTTATTDVTFVSGSGTGNAAPASWICPGDGRCTVLPVLTTSVPLPSDLVGTVRQGSVPFTMRVGHVVGAADPAITSVSVALTYDGGKSYVKVPVTSLDNHRYTVTLENPASARGKAVGLRITATDSAGGKLTQTALAAYTVAR